MLWPLTCRFKCPYDAKSVSEMREPRLLSLWTPRHRFLKLFAVCLEIWNLNLTFVLSLCAQTQIAAQCTCQLICSKCTREAASVTMSTSDESWQWVGSDKLAWHGERFAGTVHAVFDECCLLHTWVINVDERSVTDWWLLHCVVKLVLTPGAELAKLHSIQMIQLHVLVGWHARLCREVMTTILWFDKTQS